MKIHSRAIERIMVKVIPPEVLAYLWPARFRFARYYAGTGKHIGQGDRKKVSRYFNRICLRCNDIREVFDWDKEFERNGSSRGALIEDISDKALRSLLARNEKRLSESAIVLNEYGLFRIGAVFRALLLLRSAVQNIANGEDSGKGHDAILLEILGNDFCQFVIQRPGIIQASVRDRLDQQLQAVSKWDLFQKISVFIDEPLDAECLLDGSFLGKTVRLQGPSNRSSDLGKIDTDLLAVVGYSGPDSLVNAVKKIDVSLYVVHKLQQLKDKERLNVLDEVGLALISYRLERQRPFCDTVIPNFNAMYSKVLSENCNSRFNGGLELFLWLIAAGCSRVIVTNFDMFINRAFPSGYISNRPEELIERDHKAFNVRNDTMAANFAIHDPSQQYSIFNCFKHHKEVLFDGTLDEIVSSPLSDYINRLQSLYGESH